MMSSLSGPTVGPRYRALVFDFDDTLVDPRLDLLGAVNVTMSHFGGTPLTLAEVLSAQGGRTEFFGTKLPLVTVDVVVDYFGAYYRSHCLDQTQLFPGASAMLECARTAKLPVGLLTNRYVPEARIILSGFDLLAPFSLLIGGDSGFPYKPDPAGMRHILSTFGVTADEALMVGDGLTDAATAKNVGMKCALIDNGYASDEKFLARRAEFNGTLVTPPGGLRWKYPALQRFIFPGTET